MPLVIEKGCAGDACNSLVPTATTSRLAPGVLWVGTRQPATAIAATARPARNAPARTNCVAPSLISLPVLLPPRQEACGKCRRGAEVIRLPAVWKAYEAGSSARLSQASGAGRGPEPLPA